MTPIDLLESLSRFVTDATKEMALPCVVGRTSGERPERAPQVFIMDIPNVEEEKQQVPYIVLQYLTGEDKFGGGAFRGGEIESTANVRIVIVAYEKEQGGAGGLQVLSIITTIKTALLKAGVVEDRYAIDEKIEHIVYPDHEPPYYFGEMMTTWQMPVVEREVHTYDEI